MNPQDIREIAYIVAAVLFIFGLKMLSSQSSARRGNLVSSIGMLVAIAATLSVKGLAFQWIILGVVLGGAIGAVAALKVKMTAMPEMVALFNGFGGLASLLVGWAEYLRNPQAPAGVSVAIGLTILIGGVTFTGSVIAYAKLAEVISGKPVLFRGQKPLNGVILLTALSFAALFAWRVGIPVPVSLGVVIALAATLGVTSVIPIGGADMPVVIALLNSYSGLAACAAGFVIGNTVLIVSGSLVGASGIILTGIMCRAMNRSLANVLFAGVGASVQVKAKGYQGEANPVSAEDAYLILEAASSVVITPGYGMAVAQAQHVVRELGELLEKNGCEVRYAIHPVAGRMPGHMNVLLAEANVPYEQLAEPDDVNPQMPHCDVAMVIGANDVVNPAARDDEGSPLYGMPIIDVDKAHTCIVLKRSLNPGFAGVDNPLFFHDNTRMLFGDAKASVGALVSQFKE